MRSAALSGWFVLACLGCQDASEDTKANCELYQANYCAKQADCAVELDDLKKSKRDENEQSCHADFAARGLSCGSIGSVSETFDACIEDLDKWSCVQFYDVSSERRYIPKSCIEVLEP